MLAAALGWLGTVGTFAAYAMLLRGWLTSESRWYAALNTVGGLMAGTACAIYGAWPSAASNFVWAALGLYSMVGAYRRRRPELGVDGIPGPGPVTYRHTPGIEVQDPEVAGDPFDRAVRTQVVAEPHRHPGCVVPQLP